MESSGHYRVLFVCMGNICRSPTAEGVFRKLVAERAAGLSIQIDSAGTHDYHVGEAPDPRSVAAARRRGIDLTRLRARMVEDEDFDRFDLLVAMDRLNEAILHDRSPEHRRSRIRRMMEFAPGLGLEDVPDPYYGGPTGFERVLDLVEEAGRGLLDELLSDHGRRAR